MSESFAEWEGAMATNASAWAKGIVRSGQESAEREKGYDNLGLTSTFLSYSSIGSNSTVFAGGSYLVRNATISGSTLSLTGDLKRRRRKFMDSESLPEITSTFDESSWALANHTTNIPLKRTMAMKRSCTAAITDCAFCENIVLWRGHFTNTGQTSVNLSMNGGQGVLILN
ncbi:hypothetical protein C8F01DRAFT_1255965 [Mycena amicta]|nr:hypothetical protein C8F01DRAFT_1255965 [Mycena amicta]